MRFMNALEQAKWHIRTLYIVIVLLFFICLALIVGWYHTQSDIVVHVPPAIPANGLTLRSKEIPKSEIYSFAFYIWQSLNYWPNNGTNDYKKAISTFSIYLTPQFKSYLVNDYNKRLNLGEIQDRLRTIQGLNGSSYDSKNVKYLGHGTWLVHLEMRLSEHMHGDASPIKDTEISYVFRVVRYEISNSNKWGLALDGYAKDPQRIKTFI